MKAFFETLYSVVISGTAKLEDLYYVSDESKQRSNRFERLAPISPAHHKRIHGALSEHVRVSLRMLLEIANITLTNVDKSRAREAKREMESNVVPKIKAAFEFSENPSVINDVARDVYVLNTVYPIMVMGKRLRPFVSMRRYPNVTCDVSIPYNRNRYDYEGRCHWGQLKLLMSEIELLVRCRRKFGGSASYVLIYVGAANGSHLPLLADLFPEVVIHAYDGARFDSNVHRHPRIRVFEGQSGFVTDDVIPLISSRASQEQSQSQEQSHHHSLGRNIRTVKNRRENFNKHSIRVFVSDIRVSPSDEEVHKDTIDQARWGIRLESDVMMLKFRLPYPTTVPVTFKATPKDFGLPDSTRVPTVDPAIRMPYLYLDGYIQLQLFAPWNSTETRLVVGLTTPRDALKWYDPHAYEMHMSTFNSITRPTLVPDALPLDNLVFGFDRSMESLTMCHLIRAMLFPEVPLKTESMGLLSAEEIKDMKYIPMEQVNAIVGMLRHVRKQMFKSTGRQLLYCVTDTLAKHRSKKALALQPLEKVLIDAWYFYEKKKADINKEISTIRGIS